MPGFFDRVFNRNPQPGLNLGGPAPYQMPQVPYGQNPMITTAALGLLGGRTLNEGLQNVAQNAPAGLAAKTAMQRDMAGQRDTAQKRLAMNAIIKLKSGKPITPQEQAAIDAAPEIWMEYGITKPDYMEVDGQVFDKTTGKFLTGTGGAGGGGPFRGTGMDAQDSNIINRGQTDPAYRATPEYKLAWSRQFETPQFVPGQDVDGNPIVTPVMKPVPPGLQGPTGGSVAPPAGPDQQVPPPTNAATGQPRVGTPLPAGAVKTPEAVRTAIVKAETYKKSLDTNLDAYAAAIKEGGISAFPGVEQDRLNTLRNQILLDLKELNVLGVLAGPDMDIMNGMIYNPVLGSGGIGTTLDQMTTGALGGTFGIATAEQRAAANTRQLKDMLAGKVTAWKSANAAGTTPTTGAADPLGIR